MQPAALASTRRKLRSLVARLEVTLEEFEDGPHARGPERALLATLRGTAREAHELLVELRAHFRATAPRCGAERVRGGACCAPATDTGRCKLHPPPRAEAVERDPDVVLAERARRLVAAAMSAQATPRRRTSRYSPEPAAEPGRLAALARKRLADLRARPHAR